MADLDSIDKTKNQLSYDRDAIIKRLEQELLQLEELRKQKSSKYLKHGHLLRGARTEDFVDIRVTLKRVTEIIADPESHPFAKNDTQDTVSLLEESVTEIQKWLDSLEQKKMADTKRWLHLSTWLSRTRWTRSRGSEVWNFRVQNAKDRTELLHDSIKISRSIDKLCIHTTREVWVADQTGPLIRPRTYLSIYTNTSDRSSSRSGSMKVSTTAPLAEKSTPDPDQIFNMEAIDTTASFPMRPGSSIEDLERVGVGAWSEEDSRNFMVARSKTWPTLDEYFPTSTFRIPARQIPPLTIASALTAEPRVKHVFRHWNSTGYIKRHESYQQQRLGGTCEWILNDPIFHAWQNSITRDQKPLLCFGPPGVGKSVLSSFVIDTLSKTHTTLFYYLSGNDDNPGFDMAMSLLKQYCEKKDLMPESLLEPTTREMVPLVTMNGLQEEIKRLARKHPGFVIVIDGLDEVIKHEDPKHSKQIEAILAFFIKLNVKIFATSRQSVPLRLPWTTMALNAGRNATDVASFVSEAIRCRERFYDFPEEQIASCAVRVAKESEGRFLRAALSVDHILKSSLAVPRAPSPSKLKTSSSLNVQMGLDSIERHSDTLKELAMTAIIWVLTLKGPLRMAGLSEAVLVNPSINMVDWQNGTGQHVIAYDHRRIPTVSKLILDLCQGVLKEDPATSYVEFRHREIEKAIPEWLQANAKIVTRIPQLDEVILHYLSSDDFSAGPCRSSEELHIFLKRYRFLSYAALNWTRHARDAQNKRVNDLLVKFLSSANHLAFAVQVAEYENIAQSKDHTPKDLDDHARFRMSPLQAAARYGFPQVVHRLLQADGEEHMTTKLVRALYIAAADNQLEVVRILLKEARLGLESDVAFEEPILAALEVAWRNQHCDIFMELLRWQCCRHFQNRGDPADTFGSRPDRLISFSKYFIKCKGYDSESAFYTADTYNTAITHRDIEVLTLLYAGVKLGKFKLISLQDPDFPALHRALDCLTKADTAEHESILSVMEYALRNGTDPDLVDKPGNTAMFYAVAAKFPEAITLLLNYGADIDKECEGGRSVLFEAVRRKNVALTQLLLSEGASIRVVDKEGHTILHEVAMYPEVQIMAEIVYRFLRFSDGLHWFGKKDNAQNTPAEYTAADERTASFKTFVESHKVAGFVGSKNVAYVK